MKDTFDKDFFKTLDILNLVHFLRRILSEPLILQFQVASVFALIICYKNERGQA